jgi:hypothetical protein
MEQRTKISKTEWPAVPARPAQPAHTTEKEITIWVANDGQEFSEKSYCDYHEKMVEAEERIKNIPHKEIPEFQYEDMYSQWYFISKQEEIIALINYFKLYSGNSEPLQMYGKPFEYGIWHGFSYCDGGDSKDYYSHTTLKEEIEERENELKLLRSISKGENDE